MINKCIGCYYHDSKENVCTHGSPIFLDDICTDYQADEFVKQIRADTIDECIKLIGGNIKSIVGIYNKDTPLTDRASYRVAKNELIEELVKQLEQLKEQK